MTLANRLVHAVCPLALLGALAAQEAEPMVPVFTDGEAQVVEGFRKSADWIRDVLWVETEFDSDGDGKKDRMHVSVVRPKATETDGLKVPAIYETSPYFVGVGTTDSKYFWNPEHELGATPSARPDMPPISARALRNLDKSPMAELKPNAWVPRGFAVVHSSSPGTGMSQGCPSCGGENESLAPKAVIDWLCGRAKGFTAVDSADEVKATWCTGKVGMTGTSYNGTLPIAAATTGVEGLEAIIPIAPNTSYYHYYRSNGLVRHPGGYMGEDVDVLYDFINSGDPAKREWCTEHVRDGELKKNQDRITGDYSDWWAKRDYTNKLDKMKAATLMAHAWNDWNVMPEHSVRVYAALKQKGVPCMAYFHQGGHGGPPPMKLQNRWFTHFLYGVDNGVEKDPKAWIVREGDRQSAPTSYADWPNPAAVAVALHPCKGGAARGDLVAAPRGDQKTETFVDDVAHPGAALAAMEQSPNRLLYATPELVEPLHISGTPRLTIRLACSKPACNLTVWLVSLPWEPSKRITDNIVTRGWADPQNRGELRASKPLVPGEFVEFSFELQPDDQIVAAGERLGLMVFASDRDFTLWPAAGTELTIDLDATKLELPVVGGKAAFDRAITPK